MAETRFVVVDTLKGPDRRTWAIRNQRRDSATFGVDFRPGQDYAILARFSDGKI